MAGNEGSWDAMRSFICAGGGNEYCQQGYTFVERGLGDTAEPDGTVVGPVHGKNCLCEADLESDGILTQVKVRLA